LKLCAVSPGGRGKLGVRKGKEEEEGYKGLELKHYNVETIVYSIAQAFGILLLNPELARTKMGRCGVKAGYFQGPSLNFSP
jgi:hypothetical protein